MSANSQQQNTQEKKKCDLAWAEDGSIKFKVDGSDEEVTCSYEELISILTDHHYARRGNTNKDPPTNNQNDIFYRGRFWTIEEFEELDFDEDTVGLEHLIQKIMNSASLRYSFYTTREQRLNFKMKEVEIEVDGCAKKCKIFYQIYRVFKRDNLLSNKLVKQLLADPVQVEKMNTAFLDEGVIGILPILIGGDEKKADICAFAEGTFPLFSAIENYLDIRTIKELITWHGAFNNATPLDVLTILINRCPFLLDACIMTEIAEHHKNEKVQQLLAVISKKIEYWNKNVMPETFRVIEDFLKEGSMSVELDFCSQEFPKHFDGFSEMLDALQEKFSIELYMKINHVCQQNRYRKIGIPRSIYERSAEAMTAFFKMFGEASNNEDDATIKVLLDTAGVVDEFIYTICCADANGEQDPTPTGTTIEEFATKIHKENYPINDPNKAKNIQKMERNILHSISTGKPYLGHYISGTAKRCQEVYRKNPDPVVRGPYGKTDTIFIIRYESANGEQDPTPTETTIEKLLQELCEKHFPINHSDKDEKMRVMEKCIKIQIREGKPYSGYAIGGTAGECRKVYVAHPDYKPRRPSTKKAKKPKVTPDISTERKRKERSDESLSEVGAELKSSKKKGRKVMVSVRVDGQVIHQRKLLEAVISDESEASNQQSPVTGRIVASSTDGSFSSDADKRAPASSSSKKRSVDAPPGKLGISLANRNDGKGTVVSRVRNTSVLFEQITPGDRIVAIDGEDVSRMSLTEIASIMARKADYDRKLTVLKSN